MTEEQLWEMDGLRVRLASWVTCARMRQTGLIMDPTTFSSWRDSAVFEVVHSYIHNKYGRVAELRLIRSRPCEVLWHSGVCVKWCFLELVVTSQYPSRTLGQMWSVGSYSGGDLSSYPSASNENVRTYYFPSGYYPPWQS